MECGSRTWIPTAEEHVPKVSKDKHEEWRQWQEDVEGYMDTVNPGMNALLEEVSGVTKKVALLA